MEPCINEMGPLGTRKSFVKWPWSRVGLPGLPFGRISAQVEQDISERKWGAVRFPAQSLSGVSPGHPLPQSLRAGPDAKVQHLALADEADLLCRQLLAGFMAHGNSARPYPDFARLPGVATARPAIGHLEHRHAPYVAMIRTILEAVADALQTQCGREPTAVWSAGAVGRRLEHEAVLQSAAADNAARMVSLHVQAGHAVRLPLVDRATGVTVGSLVAGPRNGSTVAGPPDHLILLSDTYEGYVAYSLGVKGGKAVFLRHDIAPEEMPQRCGRIGFSTLRGAAGPSRAQRLCELSAIGGIEKRLTAVIAEAAAWDQTSSPTAAVLARKLSLRLMTGVIDAGGPQAGNAVQLLVQDIALDVLSVTMPHIFDAFRPVMSGLVLGLKKTVETANRAAGSADALQLDFRGLCRIDPGFPTELSLNAARVQMTLAV